MQQLNLFSASGSHSPQVCSNSTGQTENTGETSPTLLPTPNARDGRGKGLTPRDNMDSAIEHGATKHKTGLYSQAASLANHSHMPVNELGQPTLAGSGRKCFELLKQSGQTGSLLKMSQVLLVGTKGWRSRQCVLTWKPKVTKQGRLLFQLSPSVRRIGEIESGLLRAIPTPTTRDWKGARKPETLAAAGRTASNDLESTVFTLIGKGTGKKLRLQPAMTQWMQGFPTGWTILSDEKEV